MPTRRRLSDATSRKQGSRRREGPPPIVAVFLVQFDKRVGYSIAWSQATAGLELDGLEYKCLPSGSHNIQEDVIYFTHAKYTGLSIYRRSSSTASERNATFTAIGVLIPHTPNGLDDLWLHADPLRKLSETLAEAPEDMTRLEHYWEFHRARDTAEERYRQRSRSSGGMHGDEPASFNPRRSLMSVLDTFGPLLFPIWRAALLRERLLILQQPPLKGACDIVYVLSMLSTIPRKPAKHLPTRSPLRTPPTFVIGIHDIPDLEKDAKQVANGDFARPTEASAEAGAAAGWIACSSDKLLDEKTTLSDVRIQLRDQNHTEAAAYTWPEVVSADNIMLRATQRDLRRYIALRQSLSSMYGDESDDEDDEDQDYEADDDESHLMQRRRPSSFAINVPNDHRIVEPQSWALVAYDGYMWWASAGERASILQEEYDNDADLQLDATTLEDDAQPRRRRSSFNERPATPPGSFEDVYAIVVAYFQHMTAQIMGILTALDHTSGNNGPGQPVPVSKDDLIAMGLDPWSPNDRIWVARMVKRYFNREAVVEGASIECCGVKLY